MQEDLCDMEGKRVTLTKGVHQSLTDFRWLEEDLDRSPTRFYEIMPLQPTKDGYYDAYGCMCGGAVLLGPTAVTHTSQPQPSTAATSPEPAGAHPIIWKSHLAGILG